MNVWERKKSKCEAYTIRVRCMRIMRISNCNCLQTEFVVDLKCKFDFDASVICFRTCSLSRTCSCFCSNIRTHGKVMMIESIGARLEYINSIYVTQKQIAFSLPCYCRNWMSTENIEVHSHGTKHDVFNWNSTHEFKGQTNNQNTKIVSMPKSFDPFELNLLIISLVGIHINSYPIGNYEVYSINLSNHSMALFFVTCTIHVLMLQFTLLITHVISLNGHSICWPISILSRDFSYFFRTW